MDHFVSASCGGEKCSMCGRQATHKVGEEISHDDPSNAKVMDGGSIVVIRMRHNFTAYICCEHFMAIFGGAVPCRPTTDTPPLPIP
jgi:hypothetical protein